MDFEAVDGLTLIDISKEDDSLLSPDKEANQQEFSFLSSPLSLLPAESAKQENCGKDKILISSEDVNIRRSTTRNQQANPSEVFQLTKKRKASQFNLRKSLAWDQAFFTDEGVLDPEELSLLGAKYESTKECLSKVTEDQEESCPGVHKFPEKLLMNTQTPKTTTNKVFQPSPSPLRALAQSNPKCQLKGKRQKSTPGSQELLSSKNSTKNKGSTESQREDQLQNVSGKSNYVAETSACTKNTTVKASKRMKISHEFLPVPCGNLVNPFVQKRNESGHESARMDKNISMQSTSVFSSYVSVPSSTSINTLSGVPPPNSFAFMPGTGFKSNFSRQAPSGRAVSKSSSSKIPTFSHSSSNHSKSINHKHTDMPRKKGTGNYSKTSQHGGITSNSKAPMKDCGIFNDPKRGSAFDSNASKKGVDMGNFSFRAERMDSTINPKPNALAPGVSDYVNAVGNARPANFPDPSVRNNIPNDDKDWRTKFSTKPSRLRPPSPSYGFFDTEKLLRPTGSALNNISARACPLPPRPTTGSSSLTANTRQNSSAISCSKLSSTQTSTIPLSSHCSSRTFSRVTVSNQGKSISSPCHGVSTLNHASSNQGLCQASSSIPRTSELGQLPSHDEPSGLLLVAQKKFGATPTYRFACSEKTNKSIQSPLSYSSDKFLGRRKRPSDEVLQEVNNEENSKTACQITKKVKKTPATQPQCQESPARHESLPNKYSSEGYGKHENYSESEGKPTNWQEKSSLLSSKVFRQASNEKCASGRTPLANCNRSHSKERYQNLGKTVKNPILSRSTVLDLPGKENAPEKVNKPNESGTRRLKRSCSDPPPFSDEWIAAIEAGGEELLERKGGAVQNSPADKPTEPPNPWSPVKRHVVQQLGPFDCTKHTNTQNLNH